MKSILLNQLTKKQIKELEQLEKEGKKDYEIISFEDELFQEEKEEE